MTTIETPGVKAPKELRIKTPAPWELVLFGAAGRIVPTKQGSVESDVLALKNDTKRALERLEISDPWPEDFGFVPSLAALELVTHIYPNGASLLLSLIEEESRRRWKVEDQAWRRQLNWMLLGACLRIVVVALAIIGVLWVKRHFGDQPRVIWGSMAGLSVALIGTWWASWKFSKPPDGRVIDID